MLHRDPSLWGMAATSLVITFLVYIVVTGFIVMRKEYKDKPLTEKDSWMKDKWE